MSWALYCELMGFEPPPAGWPRDVEALPREARWALHAEWKIRLQYCEDATRSASGWHAHAAAGESDGEGAALFGTVDRDASRPPSYREKPMVSVSWRDAEVLSARLTSDAVAYRLPIEAEWEKAARGGLVGKPYPWGASPATPDLCDCDRLGEFSIRPSRALPPNGYGLHAMSGGVWEWTGDAYDAAFYRESSVANPTGPDRPDGTRVLRGGSWADGREACTVTFRMARLGRPTWRDGGDCDDHLTPNVGFRLVRVPRAAV